LKFEKKLSKDGLAHFAFTLTSPRPVSAISNSNLLHHSLLRQTTTDTLSRRRKTFVELCWAFEKKKNRIRIARNTFPKTSVPFLPILDGASDHRASHS